MKEDIKFTHKMSYNMIVRCWLSFDEGFIWSFVGPVLGIILVSCP